MLNIVPMFDRVSASAGVEANDQVFQSIPAKIHQHDSVTTPSFPKLGRMSSATLKGKGSV